MAGNAATTKGLRIGNALKQERENAKITLSAFAAEIGVSKSMLSRIENGLKLPEEHLVAKILTKLDVAGDKYDEILGMLEGADAQQWNATTLADQAQQSAALAEFEANASAIYDVAPLLVPGLLQVGPYARAIMSKGTVPTGEIAHRVATRMGRRDVIDPHRTETPAHYTALIDEAVLRRIVGSPAVMVEQLTHILRVAKWEHADIRVIALDGGWTPALSGQFSLIDPRNDGFPIVSMGTRRSNLLLHAPEDVAAYRDAVNAVLRAAMSPDETTTLIAAVIDEMQGR